MLALSRSHEIIWKVPKTLTIQLISESLFVSLFVSQLMISTELFVSHLVGHVHEGVAQYGWQHFGKADTIKCVEMQLPLF